MSLVVVRKSPPVIVRPSEPPPPAPRVTEKLSSFDNPYVKTPMTSFLVFDHPIHNAADTIKTAVSHALVYYYPFSGRIIAGGDGEFHVRCHGEGALFVAASADCSLMDVIKLFDVSNGKRMTMTLLDKLAVYLPVEAEGCGPTDPLLLMQVTQFTCGGFVVGVTWNHGIADGVGVAQFLRTVGELARGSPSPSVVPVRWDPSLPSLPTSILELLVGPSPLLLACLDVTIPSTAINRIKVEFRKRSNGQTTCTTFEAAAAVLWRCRTRAVVSDPGAMALLSFVVNVREHVGAKDGYYGNCIATQQVMAMSGAVANGNIVDLVKMIKSAKDDQLLLDKKESLREAIRAMDRQQLEQLQYNTLGLTSWRNIGFEEADFGGGTPARVMAYTSPLLAVPVCVMNLPCKGKDGTSNAFSVCVKEEHIDAFVAELARINM